MRAKLVPLVFGERPGLKAIAHPYLGWIAGLSTLTATLLLSLVPAGADSLPAQGPGVEILGPRVWLSGHAYDLEVALRVRDLSKQPPIVRVTYDEAGLQPAASSTASPTLTEDGRWDYARTVAPVALPAFADQRLWVHVEGSEPVSLDAWVIPPWASAIPTLLAVIIAITLRQVVIALFAGLWFGSWLIFRLDPFESLLRIVDTFALDAVADSGRASILVFTLLLGGMVGIISRSRGASVFAEQLRSRLHSRRRSQLATWLMGIAVFVDDYANALLVGTSMRPLYDRMRMSRAKLAFIVDATAAPVSSIALISSWVGVELGYIEDQYRSLGIAVDAYSVFIASLPYRFYPVFILIFGFIVAASARDFGPMRRAEIRALRGLAPGQKAMRVPTPREGTPLRFAWLNGLLPLVALIASALLGLYLDGTRTLRSQGALGELGDGVQRLQAIFSSADATKALLWASLIACITSVGSAVATRSISLADAMESWVEGIKSMVLACIVLVLAWSLSRMCRDLHTADFFVSLVMNMQTPAFLPGAIFLTSALISFSTGTSWGTMAIVFPVAIPMMFHLGHGDSVTLSATVSAILAGSVWGDHCSPISDTTIMSATAAGCTTSEHVNTQLPYAVLVGIVSLLLGDLAVGLELYPSWVAYPLGAAVLFAVVRFAGKPLPRAHGHSDDAKEEHTPSPITPLASAASTGS